MNPTRNENVEWEELDGGALLVDVTTGARWRLDAAAAAVWKLCDGTRTLAKLDEILRGSRNPLGARYRAFESEGLLRGDIPDTLKFESCDLIANGPRGLIALGLGAGPRRRPAPRGNSGPG